MHRDSTLCSIPEIEEDMGRKWVPKKKHEVLKAKYKCLKKLFQIYDATVVGILPEQDLELEEQPTYHRRKRSHRTKTDACAGTTELACASGDLSTTSYEQTSINSKSNRNRSCISTQFETKIDKSAATMHTECSEYLSADVQSERDERSTDYLHQINEFAMKNAMEMYALHNVPYLMKERRKLTRFQCFMQRLFGLTCRDQIHSASDSVVRDKRRRKGLRFRRLRRAKKIKSEGSLSLKSPILSYVQSMQRHCLMDTTPRQCPMSGCKMVLYGIINYNDHLNLCHFKDRKYTCHYCHEGYENEYDKVLHENQHIGISQIPSITTKIASDTQTETDKLSDEKLKKLVSFFDKITDPEQVISNITKNRASECNLRSECVSDAGNTRTISCCNMRESRRPNSKSVSSASVASSTRKPVGLPIICHFCGENFHHRRQLSLHVNLEHRVHDKFSKYHSSAGLMNHNHSMTFEDGHISVHSERSDGNTRKSDESLTGGLTQSSNSNYFTSAETVVPVETARYTWEPQNVRA